MEQWFAHINGQQYGPVSREDLAQWVAQGRVSPTDLVWTEGMANWVPAGTMNFGGLAAPPPLPPAPGTAGVGGSPVYTPGPVVEPHRGTMILIFGIVGMLCCVIFGILAWVMGRGDLQKMKAGQMDRSGQGLTQAGMILGIINCGLAILSLIIWLVMTLFISTSHPHPTRLNFP